MRCGFSHTACGDPADLYARRYGYTSASELGLGREPRPVGRGKRGTARRVLKAWLNSPPHREAMLRGSFDDAGIGLRGAVRRPPQRRRLGTRARLPRLSDEAVLMS